MTHTRIRHCCKLTYINLIPPQSCEIGTVPITILQVKKWGQRGVQWWARDGTARSGWSPDCGSPGVNMFCQLLPESIQQTWGVHAGAPGDCTPHLSQSPDSPVEIVGITFLFFIQRHWDTKKLSHRPKVTSQEVVELARFSLAKGSGPATRTQLFPHDKLLQLLIRHLRSQFSHGCASL